MTIDNKPAVRVAWPLQAGLAVGVLALAIAGYSWKGMPRLLWGDVPQPVQTAQDVTPEQVGALVAQLQARLQTEPGTVEEWVLLARGQRALGQAQAALQAYAKAVALLPKDPDLLTEYADVMGFFNNKSLEGEPMALVERALAVAPNHSRALYLAGNHAMVRKDYGAALQYWQQLVQTGAPEDPVVQQVSAYLAQVRSMAGLPAQAALTPRAPAAAASAGVQGVVSLAPALRSRVQPGDTVFIYARPADGSRMPLAIVKKQVKDLPFTFSLDDSMAMSPTHRLSAAGQVVVGARISKTGQAMPSAGDLQGQVPAVAVGASGVQVEINEVLTAP